MNIAILSGKGGAGKTFVSVNLATILKNSVYIDCDVEEPNGRLFFKPQNIQEIPVFSVIPSFSSEKCVGCKKCVDFCKFNALIYIKDAPKVFTEVCHGCGGCEMICPQNAITEIKRPIGHLEVGNYNDVKTVTGVLNLGEASGVGVIKDALSYGKTYNNPNTIIDCPPGSACSVLESVGEADFCVLVAEATAFGFHNFKMVYELATVLKKPCGVIINKYDSPYLELEEFCENNKIPILGRIPYSSEIASITSRGEIAVERSKEFKALFEKIVNEIGGYKK